MVVLRRDDDDGRVSPSPFSRSSSLEAERLNPRVLVGLMALLAKGCCDSVVVGVVGDRAIEDKSTIVLCSARPDVAATSEEDTAELGGVGCGTIYEDKTPSNSPGQQTKSFHQLVHVSS
jgi:hypothetical protein